jgi:hypothetical protein
MSDVNPTKATDCDSLEELLPLYAFGLSDESEAARVEALLPRCPGAAETLETYRALSERYLCSSHPVEPPPYLLTHLLQAAAPPPPKRPQVLWLSLAAVFIAAVLALNLWVLTRVGQMSDEIEGQSGLLVDFAAQDILTFNLVPPAEVSSEAVAIVHCNPKRKAGVIRAENFPPAQGYQVWLWRDGERDSAGTLDVDESGEGVSIFNAPQVMGAYQYISIAPPIGQEPTPVVRGGLYP